MDITFGNLKDSYDVRALTPTIKHWVGINDGSEPSEETGKEVSMIRGNMTSSLYAGSPYRFYIARDPNELAVAMLGLTRTSNQMRALQDNLYPNQSVEEIVHFFVAPEHLRRGIGSGLLNHVINDAKSRRVDRLILNSGPRYEQTSWRFYQQKFGNPVAILTDAYGKDIHAPVWSLDLNEGPK